MLAIARTVLANPSILILDEATSQVDIEISAANGYFCYACMQDFADDVYVKAFVDELRKEGIEVEIGEAEPLIFPRINI